MVSASCLFGLKAVVTGAASGIGEAVVRTLVKQDAEVLAVDSLNSNIETHFHALRRVHSAVLDINSADGGVQLAELASAELGLVDIIICNLNLFADKPISDNDEDALKNILARQKLLTETIVGEILPLMQNSPAGRIVILGFNRSVFGQDGSESYSKAEKAIAHLTRRLAAETASSGINVNYIQPGAIMTPESRRIFNNDKALRDYYINRCAAKRLGEPVDVAKVALFLATDDSVFVSGTGILVDGGIADS